MKKKQLSGFQADLAHREYLETIGKNDVQEELKKFSRSKDRLDKFFTALYAKHSVGSALRLFTQKSLVLFHSNAAVERSFSINKQCLVQNLHEDSLVSQRATYDAISAAGGVENVIITEPMIHAARNSSAKRVEALKRQKEKKDEIEQKRKSAVEEIKKIRIKKQKILEQAKEEAEALDVELEKLKKVV